MVVRAVRATEAVKVARIAPLADVVVKQEDVGAEEEDRQGRPCRVKHIRRTSAPERIVYGEVGMYGE